MDIAFDGVNMWVANYQSSNMTKLDASTGKVLGTFAMEGSATRVVFDGANIWVTGNNSRTVSRLQASDRSRTRGGLHDDTTAAQQPSSPNKHECIWCENGLLYRMPQQRSHPQATKPQPSCTGIRGIDFSNFENIIAPTAWKSPCASPAENGRTRKQTKRVISESSASITATSKAMARTRQWF